MVLIRLHHLCVCFLVQLLITISPCWALSSKKNDLPSRRQILLNSALKTAGIWLVLPVPLAISAQQPKAKGAAELDFEYYMRDLVGGNKKGGTVAPSAPPVAPPPRTLVGPLIPLLLDSDCSPNSVTVQALIQQIKSKNNGGDETAIAADIQSRVKSFKERTGRSFAVRSPWKEESVTDQYYFDFTSYALWRVAADLLPDYLDRDKFVRRIGQLLLERLQKDKLISPLPSLDYKKLTGTIPLIKQTLDLFVASQYCKGFRIRGELDDENEVFDELDNDSISTGGTVDFLASIYEPASLGASLQITGEQSRFGPDFVGCTVAAIFADGANIKSSWETFFVDPEYRPNPKDYFPNEQLYQFTLVRK